MKKYIALQVLILLSFIGRSGEAFLLPVMNDSSMWGYIDTTGKLVIPYQYEMAFNFSEERGMVAISVNGSYRYSFVDVSGKVFGGWNFVGAMPYSNGYAVVQYDNKGSGLVWAYLDKAGTLSPPMNFKDIRSFSSGIAAVYKDNGWGFINSNFKEVVRAQYSAIGIFSEGLCAVALGNDTLRRWGYVNTKGHEVTAIGYLQASKFSDHVAAVCIEVEEKEMKKIIKKKVYGYIGGNGDFLIPAKYQHAGDFNGGIAKVSLNGNEFFIDIRGNTILTLDSNFTVSDFHQGFAVVKEPSGRTYFIDHTGAVAYDHDFKTITDFNRGYSFFTQRNGVQGYIDYKGNIIWKSR
jgi:hypothetical protein